MTNMQAAVGLAQLEKIEAHIEKKRKIGKMYQEGLRGVKGFTLPTERTDYAENIYWVFSLVADSEKRAKKMVSDLAELGIGTRPFFWPMHQQPVFQKMGLFKNEKHPNSEHIARNGFYIPSGLGLSETDIKQVISAIKKLS